MEGTVTLSIDDFDALRMEGAKPQAELNEWNATLEYFNRLPEKLLDYLAADKTKLIGDAIFELHKERINGRG